MSEARESDGPGEEIPPAPFTFKLAIVLAAAYLGWRLIQGVVWVVERIF